MEISEVSIGNMALANLGLPPVQNFNQPDVASRSLKLRYHEARLQCLNAQLWNFAKLWQAGVPVGNLDTSSNIDLVAPGWRYSWVYPADALRVFEIWRQTVDEKEIPFEVTDRPGLAGGKLIHTNVPSPVFIYTRDKVDPTTFDWDFITAFAWLLASLIAMPTTKSMKMQQNAEKQFAGLIGVAAARTKNEGTPDTDVTASYQAVR